MNISDIKILNFRNYEKIVINNFAKTNILIGDNGSGKTNFLESIYILSSVRPLRNVPLYDLIRWKQNYFFVKGVFEQNNIEIGYSKEKKILKVNENSISNNKLLIFNPVVSFIPDDISIITGSPYKRRAFIDHSISLCEPEYFITLIRYNKALKQRNAQLKLSSNGAKIWDTELLKWGSLIIEKRLQFIHLLNLYIKKFFFDLYKKDVEVRYLNTFKIDKTILESFRDALDKSRNIEKRKGFTIMGPHRDNLNIIYNEKDSKVFASHGQLRSLAIALKLCVIENLKNIDQNEPVILLDDVLLELDRERRKKILDWIIPEFQTFITSTDPKLLEINSSDIRSFHIGNNSVIETT